MKGKIRLLVHAVNNGVEKNAKWRVSPNCFCSLRTIRGVFYDNVRFIYLYCRRGIDKIIVSFLDCEQSLFFFRFSKGSVSRVAIRVSRVLLDGLQKKERLLVVYLVS